MTDFFTIQKMRKAPKTEAVQQMFADADTVIKVGLHAVVTKDTKPDGLYAMASDALQQVQRPLDSLDEQLNPEVPA